MELPQERRTAHSDITSFLILSNNHFAWRLRSRTKNSQLKVVSISKVDPSVVLLNWLESKLKTGHSAVKSQVTGLAQIANLLEMRMFTNLRPRFGKMVNHVALNSQTQYVTLKTHNNKSFNDNTEVIFGEEQIIADDGTRKFLYTLEVSQPGFPRVPILRARETPSKTVTVAARTFTECFQIVHTGEVKLPQFQQRRGPVGRGEFEAGMDSPQTPAVRFLECTPILVAEGNPSGHSIWGFQGNTGSEIIHIGIGQVLNRFFGSAVNLGSVHSKLMSAPDNIGKPRSVHDELVLEELFKTTKARLGSSMLLHIVMYLRTALRELLDKAALLHVEYMSGAYSAPGKTSAQLVKDRVNLEAWGRAPFFKLLFDIIKVRIWIDLMRSHIGSGFEAELFRLGTKRKLSKIRTFNSCYRFLFLEQTIPDWESLCSISHFLSKNPLTADIREVQQQIMDRLLRLSSVQLRFQDEERVFGMVIRLYWKHFWSSGTTKEHNSIMISQLQQIWVKTAVYTDRSHISSALGLSVEFEDSLLKFFTQPWYSEASIPQSMKLLRSAFAASLGCHDAGIQNLSLPILVNPFRSSKIVSTPSVITLQTVKPHNFTIPLGRYTLLCENTGTDHTLVDTVTGRTVPVKTSHSLTDHLGDRFLSNSGPARGIRMICRQTGITPRFFFIRQPSTAEAAALFASNTGVASSIDSWLEIPPAGNPLEMFLNNIIWTADFWGESLMLYYQHALTHRVSFLRVRDSRHITLLDTFELKELWIGQKVQFDNLMTDILATRRSQFSHIAMIHNSRYILQVTPCYGQYTEYYSRVHLAAVKRYSKTEQPPSAEFQIMKLLTPANLVTNTVKLLHLTSPKSSLGAFCLTQSASPSNNWLKLQVIVVLDSSGKLTTVVSSDLLGLRPKQRLGASLNSSLVDVAFEPQNRSQNPQTFRESVDSHNKVYFRLFWSSPSQRRPTHADGLTFGQMSADQIHFARLCILF